MDKEVHLRRCGMSAGVASPGPGRPGFAEAREDVLVLAALDGRAKSMTP